MKNKELFDKIKPKHIFIIIFLMGILCLTMGEKFLGVIILFVEFIVLTTGYILFKIGALKGKEVKLGEKI